MITCDYCKVIQPEKGTTGYCLRCGAPLEIKHKPNYAEGIRFSDIPGDEFSSYELWLRRHVGMMATTDFDGHM